LPGYATRAALADETKARAHTSLQSIKDKIELLILLIIFIQLKDVLMALAMMEDIYLFEYFRAVVVKRFTQNLQSQIQGLTSAGRPTLARAQGSGEGDRWC